MNDPEDPVALIDGIRKSFEDERAAAFADHQTVGHRIKRGAFASQRQRPQLREAHLRVQAVGAGHAAGNHHIRPPGLKFVAGQFDGVERGGTGCVESVAALVEPERLCRQMDRQAGGVAVESIDRGEGSSQADPRAENLPGNFVGFFRRQGNVAEDHAAVVHAGQVGRTRRPAAHFDGDMKHRIQLGQRDARQIEAGRFGLKWTGARASAP